MFRFLPRNTDPASASWRPIRTSRRVVFPAPFGPTRPTLSPFASSRSTSAKRRRPPWDFATPLLDPQFAGEYLLVHLAGLELLDDRELPLEFGLVPVALGLPGPRDRV